MKPQKDVKMVQNVRSVIKWFETGLGRHVDSNPSNPLNYI